MTSKSRGKLQTLLAFVGVLALLASVALAAGTMRPTEATWQDTVAGEAEFAMANPHKGKSFARAVSTYGFMDRASRDSEVNGAAAFRTMPDTTPHRVGPTEHDSSTVLLQLLHLNTVGYSCATIANTATACPTDANEQLASATAKSVSETRSLNMKVSRLGLDLVSLSGTKPIRATASCSPTHSFASLSDATKIALGRDALLDEEVFLSIPGPNRVSSIPRSWGSYDYGASLHHVQVQKPGYALSQLRLRVVTTGTAGAERWNLNLILAHAECGVDHETTSGPARPSESDIWPAASTMNARMTARSEAPTALQPITDLVADEVGDEAAALEDELGEAVESGNEAGADAEHDESELPLLPDVDEAGTPEPSATTTTTTPATDAFSPATSAPADSTSDATETSAPEAGTTVPVTSAPAPASTVPAAPESAEPTTPTSAVDAPQQPQDVRVGRSFTVTGADGAELGTATVEDIVRTLGCGVELTLSITTSDEAGPGRWASIGPDDFAEVRPGGTTRDAQRINSDCEQAANSRTTALSPGNSYEIAIAFQLSDSAQKAMLRPEGTAGWIFDLPALTLPTPPQPPVTTTTTTTTTETTAQTSEA